MKYKIVIQTPEGTKDYAFDTQQERLEFVKKMLEGEKKPHMATYEVHEKTKSTTTSS